MAVTRALFFDTDFFYENTEVDENVDVKLIRPTIWDTQEIYIKELLGQPLYEVIYDEIISNGGALTTARLITLVDSYVAPTHLKYVMMQLQIPLLYKFRNKSTLTDRSDNSQPISFKEMSSLKDFYRIQAETFASRAEAYLCVNSTTYPEYTNYTSSDQVRAQDQKPTVSLYLGGSICETGCSCQSCMDKG